MLHAVLQVFHDFCAQFWSPYYTKRMSRHWRGCDEGLASSGGWKIPETVVSDTHCSTWAPSWLNDPGTSPTQGPEEQSTRETTDHPSTIPAGPTPSDPETSPTQGPEDQLTLQSTDHPSTIPAGCTTSDTETSPTQGPEEQSTRETTDHPSTTPQGSTTSEYPPVR
uniref:uncharacterized protein n=1 Tax=Pristiophorus japonicus TaxID=55135 RepID=UPI00398ED2C2